MFHSYGTNNNKYYWSDFIFLSRTVGTGDSKWILFYKYTRITSLLITQIIIKQKYDVVSYRTVVVSGCTFVCVDCSRCVCFFFYFFWFLLNLNCILHVLILKCIFCVLNLKCIFRVLNLKWIFHLLNLKCIFYVNLIIYLVLR